MKKVIFVPDFFPKSHLNFFKKATKDAPVVPIFWTMNKNGFIFIIFEKSDQ